MKEDKRSNSIHLKCLSVRLKRLRWKEVMKKEFWRKHNLLRPSISLVCRQLLNFELNLKKRKPLSYVKHNHSGISTSRKSLIPGACSVGEKIKDRRSIHSTKQHQKELKHGSENCSLYPSLGSSVGEMISSSNEKQLEDEDFEGFSASAVETSQSLQQAFIKRRDPQNRNLISFHTECGVKTIATKAISLSKPKSVPNIPSLKNVNDVLAQSVACEDELKQIEKCTAIECQDKCLCASSTPKETEGFNKNGNGVEKIKVTTRILDSSEREIETSDQGKKVEVKCGKKNFSNGNSFCDISSSSDEEMEHESTADTFIETPNQEKKIEVKCENKIVTNSDSFCDNSGEEMEHESTADTVIEIPNQGKKIEVKSENGIVTNSNSFCDSSSSSDEEIENENMADTSIDPSQFLSCNIETTTLESSTEAEVIPFRKSQNFQLNCEVRINLVPLLLKDITNTFCYENHIGGICGFRLRQDIQKMQFKANYSQCIYRTTTTTTTGLNVDTKNTAVDEVKDDASGSLPLLPFQDPFTHSLFAPIIKKDRRKNISKKFVAARLNQLPKPTCSSSNNSNSILHSMTQTFNSRHNTPELNQFGQRPIINSPQHPFISQWNRNYTQQQQPNTPIMHSLFPSSLANDRISRFPVFSNLSNHSTQIGSQYQADPILKSFVVNKVAPPHPVNPLSQLSPNTNIVLPALPPGSNYVMIPGGFNISGGVKKPVFKIQNNVSVNQQCLVYRPPQQNANTFLVPPVLSTTPPSVPPSPTICNTSTPLSSYLMPMPFSSLSYGKETQGSIPITSMTTPVCKMVTSSDINGFSSACNSRPPPLKLGTSYVGKSSASPSANLPFLKPPQLKKMSLTATTMAGVGHEDQQSTHNTNIENRPYISQWLQDITRRKEICSRNHYNANVPATVQRTVDLIKIYLSYGFPIKTSSILNAVYQMLVTKLCCPSYTLDFIEKHNLLHHFSDIQLCFDQREYSKHELPIPAFPYDQLSVPLDLAPSCEMFILKRFVFAVDKETKEVLYPLPPFCIPKENDRIDKITVVALISPRHGLGAGLIIFPHSILDQKLRTSFGDEGSLATNWVVSAHQRGGLTQSMMSEFLNGEGLKWLYRMNMHKKETYFAVDWWWCIDLKNLHSFFGQSKQISLQQMYPSYKDPLDLCLGVALERLWGVLVRNWCGVSPGNGLQEHEFPKFIHKAFQELCDPRRLQVWCRSGGLHPVDASKAKTFAAQTADLDF